MKNLLAIVMISVITMPVYAQQSFNSNVSADYEHRIGLVGMGSLNTEEFEKINASGKFAGYAVPFLVHIKSGKKYTQNKFDENGVMTKRKVWKNNDKVVTDRRRQWIFKNTAYFAYNINATNTDSLLPSTVLFPELGKASFMGALETGFITFKKEDVNLNGTPTTMFAFSLLTEFASKNVNITTNNENNTEDVNLFFNVLHYSIGTKFMALQNVKIDDKNIPVSFAVIPYIHWMNIPNEDQHDFEYAFAKDKNNILELPSFLFGYGTKIVFAVNHFQFFADYRQVFDVDVIKISDESKLKGFTSNIGFAVSAEILEFK